MPDSGTDVVFNLSASKAEVSVTTELPPVSSLFVTGAGASFNLESAAKMRVSGAVTNFSSTAYQGGSYAFGDEMVIGYTKGWNGNSQSSQTCAQFTNAKADVAGRVFVTGYSGNGLDVGEGAFLTCAGYLDSLGTRNVSRVHDGGVLHSTADIVIADAWPNAANPESFVVDSGTVTNEGALKIAYNNAGGVPVNLRNGAEWVQKGNTLVGCSNQGNVLNVLSASKFLSSAAILISATGRTSQNAVVVDGESTLKSEEVWVGGFDGVSESSLTVLNDSAASVERLYLGGKNANMRMSLVVAENATLHAANLSVGGELSSSDELGIAITNAVLTVENAVAFPVDTTSGAVSFSIKGASASPAVANFPGGLIIGAGKKSSKGDVIRRKPTLVHVEDAVIVAGTSDAEGASTSGDVRIGALNVGGAFDVATNRLEIAGRDGCFIVNHRMMAAGNAEICFRVPEGGYAGTYGCGLYGKNFYITDAKIIVDVSKVETDGTYLLAKATNALNLDAANLTLVTHDKQRAKLEYQNTAEGRYLAVTVKRRYGFAIILR